GYDFGKIVERTCNLFQVEKDIVFGNGRQKNRVMSRALICYWAVAELGMTMVDVARKFDVTPSAVSYSVRRGEKMAKKENFQLEI
ncbi:MAG: hypothetical protein WA151_13590, partial [Desulfatirhabdiaceae bacterium]